MKPKELAKEYGVTAMQVGKRRKSFFPDTEGGDLTKEEIAVLREYYEGLDDLEERKAMEDVVKPRYVEGVITYTKPNCRRVEVRLLPNYERIIALMHTPHCKQFLMKKTKFEVIEDERGKHYRHESLSGRAWQC